MSAEDSSIADGGESGTPPQLEQVAASVSASVRAPLLVTIGPQCAGKTTLLRTLSLARRTGEGGGGDNGSGGDGDGAARSAVSVRDVAIDDHPSVCGSGGGGGRCCRSKAINRALLNREMSQKHKHLVLQFMAGSIYSCCLFFLYLVS